MPPPHPHFEHTTNLYKYMHSVTAKSSTRIEYIDALRGFTMILVVFAHVEWFTFDMKASFSLINELFMSFRMPLFFFISGFISYKENVEWNRQTWCSMSKKKMLVQIIPTLVFGIAYTCLYLKVSPEMFVASHTKLGYWFTIVLFEMFLLVYTMNYALHLCPKGKQRNLKLIGLVTLTAVLFIARLVPVVLPSCQNVFDILCLHQTIKYFPFFAFGYICSMYKDIFNKYLENKYATTSIIVLFAVMFYVMVTYLTPNKDASIIIFFTEIIVEIIAGILGLLIVYNTFKTYAQNFTSEKKAGRALQSIGRRTLDIYLLHYFFLPYLPQLKDIISDSNNSVLELAIGGSISICVIWTCMVVSNILRTSPILGKYLFGAK